MEKLSKIKRYSMLIEKLERKHFPSMKELVEYFESFEYVISQRTIERDFKRMRFDFGLEIVYDHNRNGYFIDYDSSTNVKAFFRYLEIATTAELFNSTWGEGKKTLEYIQFDELGGLKGVNNLKPILQAIQECRVISFNHYNFQTNTHKYQELRPYILKEYSNRWYVAGFPVGQNEVRTFGVDRIEDLKLHDKKFQMNKKANVAQLFADTIGLVFSGGKEKVVLSFTPLQGLYVKTLPLHSSQKVLLDNQEEFRIQLNVTPNYELIQIILKQGKEVKVIEPEWLKMEVKDILVKALNNY